MGKKRPALVLTSAGYNQTGLMMVCPISTSIRGAAIEVPIEGLDRPTVVLASQVHTIEDAAHSQTSHCSANLQSVYFYLPPVIQSCPICFGILQTADCANTTASFRKIPLS
ncbi:type II toxin-antitoxin system PemK/MazF family toxin [Halothiobacillus sp.]|uniref:type II toxin-antitoxin system PemK/MazF family toxin n=1 Tax=Halothiobacillus sp. TaxID=1891311 RepID=UPI002987C80C|nr:type II toxin-antitoxin system PemK/MazF family toxin [Halothiobacillus sp.]